MDVLYTINSNFLDIMLVSIYSLVDNSSISDIKLHVVTSDFSNDDYKKLEDFSNLMGLDLTIYPLEENPIDKYNIPNWNGSQIANARLFYPKIINDNDSSISNLLYLDADTIIVSDISSIEKFKDNSVSACLDLGTIETYKRKLGVNDYFNSGVIYFNMDKFLEFNIEDKILNLKRNDSIQLSFPDQDCFNIVLKNKISKLPFEYNLSPHSFILGNVGNRLFYNPYIRNIDRKEVMKAHSKPVILHSYGCANIKPWSDNKINPFNEYFTKYINIVNSEFELEKLSSLKSILANHHKIFNGLLIAKSYIPKKLEYKVRKISLNNFHNKN